MRYQICHQTKYSFNQPVILQPHQLRLCPRSDRFTQLEDFNYQITPLPQGVSEVLELDGHDALKVWFSQEIVQLEILTTSIVVTACNNPFAYLLEPGYERFPWDYSHSLWRQLQPYLDGSVLAPQVIELAQELRVTSQDNTLDWLFQLNQRIYQDCQYIVRTTGAPLPSGITWGQKQGTCRDYAVLFMDVCRANDMAARFVSGYQEGDPKQAQSDLHAWVEVYLPGAGWRGYDPTLGLVVSDRHIPVAASAIPQYAAPVEGQVIPTQRGLPVTSELETQISLVKL